MGLIYLDTYIDPMKKSTIHGLGKYTVRPVDPFNLYWFVC